MRVNGRKPVASVEYAVIPRPPLVEKNPDGTRTEINQDIVFTAAAVLDYTPFEKLCPRPVPPRMRMRGESQDRVNVEDPEYNVKLGVWGRKQTQWIILQSLRATDGLEWETVKMDDPDTYENYTEELKDCGFSPPEINQIVGAALIACALTDTKIEEARKRFLAGRELAVQNFPSHNTELLSTANGKPANGSGLDHQESKEPSKIAM